MPSSVGPNTFGEENLVFGYDLGDVSNSYKGEPTVNQYTNPDFSNGTTGWIFASWDSGRYTYTTETVAGPFNIPVTALKITRNTSDTSFAHFHQGNGGKYVTSNQYTLSVWVKGLGTFRGNSQWGGVEQSFTLTGQWQYVKYTVTAPNTSNYPYWAAELITQNVPMYFVFAQSEQKSHATPFINGIRSATQGLLDLTGNTSIDLSSVSFDSNAQMTFDGTDDILYTGLFAGRNPATDPFTVEAMVKSDVTSGARMWIDATNNGTNQRFYSALIDGTNQVMGIQGSAWSDTIPNDTNWHHQVIVMDGTTAKAYNNGELASQKSYTSYTLLSGGLNIGGRAGYRWLGDITMFKIYNRALTASEVQSNYRAVKNRFNI
jgi:hypothetical protein